MKSHINELLLHRRSLSHSFTTVSLYLFLSFVYSFSSWCVIFLFTFQKRHRAHRETISDVILLVSVFLTNTSAMDCVTVLIIRMKARPSVIRPRSPVTLGMLPTHVTFMSVVMVTFTNYMAVL